jgi:hypothetical protein
MDAICTASVPYQHTRLRWRSRALREDGVLEYVFKTTRDACRFTIAMNLYRSERARMVWQINIDQPFTVEARALGGWSVHRPPSPHAD